MSQQAWVDLSSDDIRRMLISLIGHRFGDRPEEHLDEIRAERAGYARKFIQMAGITPTDHVLDLGSGCGFGTAEIARKAGRVIACDISPAYLSFAQRECADLPNLEFRQIVSRELSSIESRSIDAVISMAVFIHLNLYDIHLYFEQFRRVVKPGGKVLIDIADSNGLFPGPLSLSRLNPFRALHQDQQFLDHAGFYRDDPSSLAGLMQWNSAPAIKAVARQSSFRFIRRRGHKLLFQLTKKLA